MFFPLTKMNEATGVKSPSTSNTCELSLLTDRRSERDVCARLLLLGAGEAGHPFDGAQNRDRSSVFPLQEQKMYELLRETLSR